MNRIELEQQLEDAVFVIFGVTGDLVKRKLMPAIYELTSMNLLPKNFKILATTRRNTTFEEVFDDLTKTLAADNITADPAVLERLAPMITMVDMDIGKREDYQLLATQIEQADNDAGKQLNRLYYLAVPPDMFETIVDNLGCFNLHICDNDENSESRLLIEKPFGHNTESAVELIGQMEKVFDEKSIYRVDHYLAKETVQNIMTFRFSNPLFSAVWDGQSIDHIMITASEKLTIEGRTSFYESTGALRDLIQSHLLQLLAIVTMDEPIERTAESIHDAKLHLLSSIRVIKPEEVESHTVRGQYQSYKTEVGNPESQTETYAAIRLKIDNDRWRDTPVLLRTGKALHEKVTEITVIFKDREDNTTDINALTIRIQPNEGIVMSLQAKKPSLQSETELVHMKFFYNQSFGAKQPDSYERVLIDAIRGDKTLFTTDQEVLASWKIIENILTEWAKPSGPPLEIYENGSWGPKSADVLAESAGAGWMTAYVPTDTI